MRLLLRVRCDPAVLASLLLLGVSGQDLTSKPTEFQVKAAYLYNFGRFVGWPEKETAVGGDTFNVCVLGQDPFGPVLDTTIAGARIGGAQVAAKRIAHPQEAVSCRILFISRSEDSQLKETLVTLDNLGVLTVSDMPQFARRGGMVGLLLDGTRVRFEVNLAAANRAGLNLSSELLKLAVAIRKVP